jgi:hypothetical protein
VAEPVASGIVSGLKEPGGNVTGFSYLISRYWFQRFSQ